MNPEILRAVTGRSGYESEIGGRSPELWLLRCVQPQRSQCI